MAAHELVTPTTNSEWESYHRIRREVLFEARGLFGVYDASHPGDRAAHHHPKLLVCEGDHVGVVRVDIEGDVAALRRVAIRADVQRRGHGRALLDLVQRFARDAGCTQLVSSVAPDAVAFYQKFGFVVEKGSATGPSVRESVYMIKALDSSTRLGTRK
jgi:GNAT superfamily N-acetyltransferase